MSHSDEFIGKMVRIADGCEPYFKAGDIGKIQRWDGSNYWVDFNDCGNDSIHGNGVWCTDFPRDSELINPPEV